MHFLGLSVSSLYVVCHMFVTGAQSDSEVTSVVSHPADGPERGYTSDSELYEAQARQSRTAVTSDQETTDKEDGDKHGSWVLVSWLGSCCGSVFYYLTFNCVVSFHFESDSFSLSCKHVIFLVCNI